MRVTSARWSCNSLWSTADVKIIRVSLFHRCLIYVISFFWCKLSRKTTTGKLPQNLAFKRIDNHANGKKINVTYILLIERTCRLLLSRYRSVLRTKSSCSIQGCYSAARSRKEMDMCSCLGLVVVFRGYHEVGF